MPVSHVIELFSVIPGAGCRDISLHSIDTSQYLLLRGSVRTGPWRCRLAIAIREAHRPRGHVVLATTDVKRSAGNLPVRRGSVCGNADDRLGPTVGLASSRRPCQSRSSNDPSLRRAHGRSQREGDRVEDPAGENSSETLNRREAHATGSGRPPGQHVRATTAMRPALPASSPGQSAGGRTIQSCPIVRSDIENFRRLPVEPGIETT